MPRVNQSEMNASPGVSRTVVDAMMALAPETREVLLLACVQGMHEAQICAMLGLKPSEVNARLKAGLHEMSAKGCPEEFLARVAPELGASPEAAARTRVLVDIVAHLPESSQNQLEKAAKRRRFGGSKNSPWSVSQVLAWAAEGASSLVRASVRPALALGLTGLIAFGVWKLVEARRCSSSMLADNKLPPPAAQTISSRQVLMEGGVVGSFGWLGNQFANNLRRVTECPSSKVEHTQTPQGTSVSVRETQFFNRPTLTYGVMTEKTTQGAQGQPSVTYVTPEGTTNVPAEEKKQP